MRRAVRHHADLHAFFQNAVFNAHQNDDAQIRVVPRIDQHRLQRRVDVALRRRQFGHDAFQNVVDADARFRRRFDRVRRVDADHVLDLRLDLFGVRGGQVDFVDDGHQFVVGVQSLVHVRQRLRLHPLRRVDDQQRSLARRQRTADLVSKVDVPRRVEQRQRAAGQRENGLLGKNRDAPAALLRVGVEKRIAVVDAAERADDARPVEHGLRQRRLARVHMREQTHAKALFRLM